MAEGCGRGRGHGGSLVVSLTSQIQVMQATFAALATGTDGMSTLTDLLRPTTQTPTPPTPTDQSTTSVPSKQRHPQSAHQLGG
jgi:hypothetical protein